MRIFLYTFVTLAIWVFYIIGAQAQTPADTLKQPTVPKQVKPKELPQIQLQEYTIVGLSRITLPRKVRTQIIKNVQIEWSENQAIYQKVLPEINFQFARVKPFLLRLYEFPWLDSRIHYGSYNRSGISVNTQFKAGQTLPYLSIDFDRSDGHLENAQWTIAGMQAGIHAQLHSGHLLHLGTDYRSVTRGIWGGYSIFKQDWKAQNTRWNIFGSMEQKWSNAFRTSLGGTYYLDDHESAFKYADRGFDTYANFDAQIQDLHLGGEVKYQTTKISIDEGNLTPGTPDTVNFTGYKASLINTSLFLQQSYSFVTAGVGILSQRSKEDLTTNGLKKVEDNYLNPHFRLSFGLEGQGNIYLNYMPGAELFRFRDAFRQLPFSDMSQWRIVNYTSRFEGGLNVNYPRSFELNAVGSYAKAEKYPAIFAPADSLNAIFTHGGYPGWTWGVLDEAIIQELRTRLRWEIVPKFRVLGLLTYRKSEIKKYSRSSLNLDGNEIPYLPDLEFYGELKWNFYLKHKITLAGQYTGKRFDDIANNNQLDGYFLINTRLDLQISEIFGFFIAGENLLDTRYDIWRGFQAPGITGLVGLKVRM